MKRCILLQSIKLKDQYNKIVILMALKEESQGLVEQLNLPIYYTGVGKINAAMCATEVALRESPDLIINLGSAGSSRFLIGSLVEVIRFRQKDMDVSALGFPLGVTPMEEDGGDIKVFQKTNCISGVCGTGDSFETKPSKLECDLVEMEAYAIAKVCRRQKIDFLCLKYITDGADGNSHLDWSANLNLAAKAFKNQIESHL